MQSRDFKDSDLAEISQWFASTEWPLPAAPGLLPEIGVVVELEDSTLAACGWLYTTKSTLAILSWTGTNSELEQSVQSAAFGKLVESLQNIIKQQDLDIQVLLCITKSDALSEHLKKYKFRTKKGYNLCTWLKAASK